MNQEIAISFIQILIIVFALGFGVWIVVSGLKQTKKQRQEITNQRLALCKSFSNGDIVYLKEDMELYGNFSIILLKDEPGVVYRIEETGYVTIKFNQLLAVVNPENVKTSRESSATTTERYYY